MKRENSLDLLRIIACVMAIILYVSAYYVIEYEKVGGIYFTIGNLWDSFSRPAVPIFVLLAGRYALSNEKNIEIDYYKKILKNIYIPTIIYSALYFGYSYLLIIVKYILNFEIEDKYSPIKHWIIGKPYYLEQINFYNREDILKYLRYFWMFNQFKFINYLGYFILGYSLRNKKINSKLGVVGAIISLLLMFLMIEITRDQFYYSNNFLFVMFAALLLYISFSSLKINKTFFNSIDVTNKTFNIYLLHAGVLSIIQLFFKYILNYEINPLYGIPILIVITFIISYFIAWIIENILKLKVQKISKNKV